MSLYRLIRPAIFRIDAERAHRLTIAALRLLPGKRPAISDPILHCDLWGMRFPSPVGLAAGFDKDAEVPEQMFRFGFGFVEVGTLTPQPQPGNPLPRLFRLAEDQAVINRMGFNNRGQANAHGRLAAMRRPHGIIGVNIGANKDAADRIADYAAGVRDMGPVADYLTINISSPNTPGLRALQDRGALDALLAGSMAARAALPGERKPPIFLKVAPDLEPADIDDIVTVAIDHRVDAVIISNTTITRPALRSGHRDEAGGLSGAPVRSLAAQRLADFRHASGGRLRLIAAGGIADADEAYARILAGASLIQLYSALVYHGPSLARRIGIGIAARLRRDGFVRLSDAVGAGAGRA